jgi:manganese/zinc/iron transport system permease protein
VTLPAFITSPTPSEWWMLATASLCGAACALCGCYLVLRRMSLLGDAITHAILPGLAGAFLLTGTRSIAAMLLGAMVVGLLTAGLSSWLTRRVRVAGDAALGAVFTSMFALGVILISQAASGVDLDPGCVLYGLLEFVGVDTVSLLGVEIPRAIPPLAIMLALLLGVVLVLGRPLTLVCFDVALAATIGGLGMGALGAAALHYLAIALIAATSVVSFEAVGSILVVAMLVGPPMSARLWTDRLGVMLLLSLLLGVVSAILGGLAAIWANVSAAGAIACAVGAVFVVSILISPRHGVILALLRRWLLTLRVQEEDVLGQLYRVREVPTTSNPTPSDHPAWGRLALLRLRLTGMITPGSALTPPVLTPKGVLRAAALLRAHRLWESYLAKDLNLALDHLHEPAERTEHFIDEVLAAKLDAVIASPLDPQGKPIPQVPPASASSGSQTRSRPAPPSPPTGGGSA